MYGISEMFILFRKYDFVIANTHELGGYLLHLYLKFFSLTPFDWKYLASLCDMPLIVPGKNFVYLSDFYCLWRDTTNVSFSDLKQALSAGGTELVVGP